MPSWGGMVPSNFEKKKLKRGSIGMLDNNEKPCQKLGEPSTWPEGIWGVGTDGGKERNQRLWWNVWLNWHGMS